jgi:hypothetical protein
VGTTTNYAWPYPELTDPPDGAGQIKALATAADATVKGNDYKSGTMTVNYSTGFDNDGRTNSFQRQGRFIILKLYFKRTGTALTATATGSFTGAPQIGTLADNKLWAAFDGFYLPYTPFTPALHTAGGIKVNTDGAIYLVSLYPNATLAQNQVCISTGVYVAASA